MASVRRFVIPGAFTGHQDVDIDGLGVFVQGVLDIDIYDSAAINTATSLSSAYGIVDLGVIDKASTVQMIIVSVPDQVTDAEVAAQVLAGTQTQAVLKAAYVPSDRLVLSPTAPLSPVPGTVWINTSTS